MDDALDVDARLRDYSHSLQAKANSGEYLTCCATEAGPTRTGDPWPGNIYSIRMTTVDTEVEIHEAVAWGDLWRGASDRARGQWSLDSFEVGGAAGVIAGDIDVLAFNRVIGLGLSEPVTDELLTEIRKCYSSQGASRFFLQVHPEAATEDLRRRLEESGYRHHNNWVKLVRGEGPVPEARTDLRIELIGEAEAEAFGRIVVDCFEWPQGMGSWIAEVVGRPGWRHYLAFDGDRPVATGATFIRNQLAWLDFAATLPTDRVRGSQGALLARRIRDALDLGCRRLMVETAEQRPEKPSPSYRNTLRFGFQRAYLRPNFLCELKR